MQETWQFAVSPAQTATGRVLVVDDSATTRAKISKAVEALGYEAHTAADGEAALLKAAELEFDILLLDIMMPRLSGFDVIARLKANPRLRHLPIVVISSLNDESTSVARAIEMGAEDVLPKDFDRYILRARIGAGVERKRLRDLEIRYLDQVERLTQAAALLESGRYDPRKLNLDDVVARPDGLGKLASVFMSMAQKVYDRERTLASRVSALGQSYHLSGLALIMVAAALWATVGVASESVPHELAVSDEVYGFARTIVAGPAILLLAALTGGAGSLMPKPGSLPGFITFGICCAIFQICLFKSFTLLGVTITVFITVCLPPVLGIMSALWRRSEAVTRNTLVAVVLAAAGLMTFVGNDVTGSNLSALIGLLLSVCASVAFLLMTQSARALAADHSPILVSGLGLIISAVILAPAAFVAVPDWHIVERALTDWRSSGVLIYLGLGPTALAYICYCGGMARCRSAVAGLVASMIEPAVAAGLAFLFLRETLSAWQSLGCVVMLVAMITLWFDKNTVPSPVKS